jgi:hypothetical protein
LGGSGGGIWNVGALTLDECTIADCSAGRGGLGGNGGNAGTQPGSEGGGGGFGGFGGAGGGIYSGGCLVLNNSTLSLNRGGSARLGGEHGMPWSSGPALPGFGGDGGGMVTTGNATLTNCTVSGNVAGNGMGAGHGGGIKNGVALTLRQCTVVSNATGGPLPESPFLNGFRDGGGIWNGGAGVVQLANTIVALNSDYDEMEDFHPWPDVAGPFTSLGHNLIGNAAGGTGFTNTDWVGSPDGPLNPGLGPLADNGGPTWTHALLPGSPAMDAGDNADAPPSDQRGLARVVCAFADLGAFEAQSCQPRIRSIRISTNGSCCLRFSGAADATYTLQASTNLVHWTDLAVLPASPSGLFEYTDSTASDYPQRFHRLRGP